jgi:dolichyl-phosphate-mannose--protein O-mannosyl transferase
MCKQKEATFLETLDDLEWIIAPILFTLFAFFTRMYKIGLSPIVTWDEAQYTPHSHPLHAHTNKGHPVSASSAPTTSSASSTSMSTLRWAKCS